MKYFILVCLTTLISGNGYSNGMGKDIDKYPMNKKEKEELKLKRIKSHENLLKKEAIIKQRMEENPRNKAIIESFGDVSSEGKSKKKSKYQKASQ
jgi:hypothetical protein